MSDNRNTRNELTGVSAVIVLTEWKSKKNQPVSTADTDEHGELESIDETFRSVEAQNKLKAERMKLDRAKANANVTRTYGLRKP